MKKITKIAIIGGGFYGSYLAYKLSFLKKFKIELFEKNNEILAETAIKNQYRLHTGFHYPRSEQTINQTINGTAASQGDSTVTISRNGDLVHKVYVKATAEK